MLFPIKLKLASYEAEAMRRYLKRMFELSFDPNVRNEVIVLAEYYPRIETLVRGKIFRPTSKISSYKIPLSVARILWARWQKENNGEILQMVLGKIDYELNALNKRPDFPTELI